MLLLKCEPSFVRKKPIRLPRSVRMTIAAGFVCKDGVILCADTQETIPGYTKTDAQKLRSFECDPLNL
jgi:hypothetical protein